MHVNGKPQRTIWLAHDGWAVEIIDQTRLPHEFVTTHLESLDDAARAIRDMLVRGAPLVGATAAYGLCLALHKDSSDTALEEAYKKLFATRPTAVNLRWALDDVVSIVKPLPADEREEAAYKRAAAIAEDDVAINKAMGRNGLEIIKSLRQRKDNPESPFNILTHCNAGWLATVDWGTALAPIYMAHDAGISVHVWVDETRPRNQGASLTAWELKEHGVPHTLIVDNVGGHLMQHRLVDMCIVGTDRTTAAGDVCNKVGTYLKALAAMDNGVPFYVALPSPTIDWTISDGVADIPIERRDPMEVTHIQGRTKEGEIVTIDMAPKDCQAANYAFDVTPSRLITGLITDRGVCPATPEGLLKLYPDKRRAG